MTYRQAWTLFFARCLMIAMSLIGSLALLWLLKKGWAGNIYVEAAVAVAEWGCLLAATVLIVTKATEPLYLWFEEAKQEARSRRDNPIV